MKFSTKPLQQNWSEKRREIQIKTSFIQQPYYVGILTRTIYSNSKKSKQFLKRNAFELITGGFNQI